MGEVRALPGKPGGAVSAKCKMMQTVKDISSQITAAPDLIRRFDSNPNWRSRIKLGSAW